MVSSSSDDELRPLGPTAQAPFAENPETALREIFGHSSFRRGQREVIERLVEGDDVLVVMPTGCGKSLCYQLAGALTQGVTLVVSPLIALMKDQVDALESTGLPATTIHSAMSWREQRGRIDEMYMGDYKLVYVSPERFRSRRFCRALEDVEIGLFAVDEAHCVSHWGHDFRPDYRRLADVRSRFGNPRTVALTATATETVQRDILEGLGLPDAEVITSGFERPNLYFEVVRARNATEKLQRATALIDYLEGESVIVYAATRKRVRSVRKKLQDHGIDAAGYHGGMGGAKRRDIQEAWSAGEVPVLVATSAFGMGVDKPDVRAVIHYEMPGSIEEYYQQAGRAGRDGETAYCLLLFNRGDTGIHEWFADNTHPLRMELIRVWLHLRSLGEGKHETTPEAISKNEDGPGDEIHPMAVDTCLTLLSRAGHIRRGGGTVQVVDDIEPLELNIEFGPLSERRRNAKKQVAQLVEYAESSECFQRSLIEHFGADPDFGTRCEHCGNCDPPPEYVSDGGPTRRAIRCDDAPREVMRRVLEGVARAGGRRGTEAVAGMLVGSKARAVRQAGFTDLDTYASLGDLYKKDVAYLIDLFARHGLVRRDEHGCVLLSSRGVEVMQGAEAPGSLLEALDRDFC